MRQETELPMKIFIFLVDAHRVEPMRIVLARSRDHAEKLILTDNQDSLVEHLLNHMAKGKGYHHCRSTREALREYFPVVVEKSLDLAPGTIFGAHATGDTMFLSR